MQIGLFGSASAAGQTPDVDSASGYDDFIAYNVLAEELGFHSSFLVEHHFTGYGQVSASLTLLTWLACRTSRLRFGTSVLVLPWHNPVLVAEQAAAIDLLSRGRLDLGVGKGYRYNEFRGFCIPMEEAEARFNESLDVIIRAWTSRERFSHQGRFWQFDDVVVEPAPVQRPHPPLWQGAGAPESIRRVAAYGHGLLLDQFASFDVVGERISLFRSEVERRGGSFDPRSVAVCRAFYVARNQAEKEAAIERRIAAQRRLTRISQRPDGQNKASIMAFSDTREATEESALFGTAEEIVAKIERLKAVGVDYLLVNGIDGSVESLRRFATEIMPAICDPEPASRPLTAAE